MLKQAIILLGLSLLIILSMSYAQQGVQFLINAHDWVAQMLLNVFTPGQIGNLARSLIALLTIPILAALIPTALYWAVQRHWFPYFIETVWVVWLIQVGALLIQF